MKPRYTPCTIDELHPNWKNQELHPDMEVDNDEE